MRLALALALVPACSLSTATYTGGPGDDGGTTNEDDIATIAYSGHRLQIVRYAFTATTPYAIHDSVLDVDCFARQWADGSSYCTPVPTSAVTYGDSACAIPLVEPADPMQTTNLAAAINNDDFLVTHLYLGGNATTVTQFYDNSSGTCLPASSTPATAYVATEIAPSQLVKVTSEHDATDVMSYFYTRASDGVQSVSTFHIYDNTLGTDCIEGAQSGKLDITNCLPQPLALTSQFDDSSCTHPLQGASGPISSTPALYTQVFPTSGVCFQIDHTYPLQGAVTRSQVFTREAFSDICSASATGAQMYTATAAPIPLPQLAHDIAHQSPKRIKNAVRTVGSKRLLDGDFYDTMLDTYCEASVRPDGQVVCIPEGLDLQTLFTDAACTLSLTVATLYEIRQHCGFAMPKYARQSIFNATIQVVPITDDPVPPLYDASTGTCQPVLSGDMHFSVGAPLPLSTFATGSIETDPVAP